MAWTAPKTFVASVSLSAAELNIYLRDNMLEQVANKCTSSNAGWYPVVTAPNTLTMRERGDAAITSNETTGSTVYTDLGTPGPSVTVTTGIAAMVLLSVQALNATLNASCRMSFQVSGATDIDPSDNYAVVMMDNSNSGNVLQYSQATWVNQLNEGANTFTCKYRSGVSGSGNASFAVRRITVMPMS